MAELSKETIEKIQYAARDSEMYMKMESRAKTLVSRGISDEKLLLDIIRNEQKNYYTVPSKLRCEMYDKMNYMCRRYMDRIARFELGYDFVPDIEAFKSALICFFEAAPVMHSRFCDNHINPYWKVCDYKIDDILSVKESDDFDRDSKEFLLRDIDLQSNVQMEIIILIGENKCRICFMWNHMCMDGGDLKHFLFDLFRNYNEYRKSGEMPLDFRTGTRGYEAVYADMIPSDKRAAKKLFANVSAKDNHSLPFSEKSADDKKILVRRMIPKEIFEPARLEGKKYGATVNDVLAAAYIKSFYDITNCVPDERVGISCAVDLRRYIKSIHKTGYTNHTTFMPCVVNGRGADCKETLKKVVECTKKVKGDKFMGLHGLPLLNIAYSTMVYAQAELVVGAFYNNANLALSNVGAMNIEALSLDGNKPEYAAVAGAAKNKPCAMMTALTLNGNLSVSICINGTEKDEEMLQRFFGLIEKNLKELSA